MHYNIKIEILLCESNRNIRRLYINTSVNMPGSSRVVNKEGEKRRAVALHEK